MSWEEVVEHGGSVRYAIVIEGWPEIWVTDSSITLTDSDYGARGRAVYPGLLREGLQIHERALLAQGKIEGSPMAVRVRSSDNRDRALHSFARVGQVVGTLSDDLAADDGVLPLLAPLAAPGYYHVGTEAIHATESESVWLITRAHWDTQAQSFTQQQDDDLLSHRVYDRPRTAEGRRLTLYAWGPRSDGTGYDPTGNEPQYGVPIWRGYITTPPRLEDDGLTWRINADPIYAQNRQQLCARSTEVKPVGIYHSSNAPLYVYLLSPTFVRTEMRACIFFARDAAQFTTQTRVLFDSVLADNTISLEWFFSSIQIEWSEEAGWWALRARTVASPANYDVHQISIGVNSHVVGGVLAYNWRNVRNNHRVDGINGGTFQGDSTYEVVFDRGAMPDGLASDVCSKLFYHHVKFANLSDFQMYLGASTLATQSDIDTYDGQRIYVDKDWSTVGANAISIDLSTIVQPEERPFDAPGRVYDGALQLFVEDFGFDSVQSAHWIRVRVDGGLRDYGWITAGTVIKQVYMTEEPTNVVGFVQSLVDRATEFSNDGNVPFIRDTDFDLSTEIVSSVPEFSDRRSFAFTKPVSIEDVIAEELKLIGYMWTVREDAKPGFTPIPILTGTIAPTRRSDRDLRIGRAQLLTPAAGDGSWGSYAIQDQGLVTIVSIKTRYDALEDDHKGTTHVVADANLLSHHKRRGTTECTIAPKSTAAQEIDEANARVIAARVLSVLGREYVVFRVEVSWPCFYMLLGDVVLLTNPYAPNSNGTRGVTDKRCVVVSRRWNLDPGQNKAGELELFGLMDELSGYTPAGVITGQSGSGTAWTVVLDDANEINVLLSPRGDGDVASTFAAGDAIRIVQRDAATPTVREGTVLAVNGDNIDVALTASWTPGASSWALEYGLAPNATSSQRLYCFVAGSDGLIDGTDQARRFG